ncbi:hypothetical protein [Rubinisphaera sp.]|uniref:hypothetical protein n=1 Tax=Rubinisphaera sp. TaxID=2024857 RepID=UPI000C1057FC|nr:hypothetical protein [Rubinisphaera sp.]MBV08298.1 hypothetical protein [Rubinisphaera sp.]HCS51624.1 hypothetical protein [Planctomycetaceae bacterium]|tara:strand:+ start:3543 stop:4148 length:606 start_codon:yes stop_codon:yes gene_type:complete
MSMLTRKLTLINCNFILLTGAFLLSGCARPQEPSQEEETAEVDSQSNGKADETTDEKSNGTSETGEKSEEESNSSAEQPGAQTKNDSSNTESGKGAIPQRGGTSGEKEQMEDVLSPKTAEDAAELAEQKLSLSEDSSDLSDAYHHASIALHYARKFPGDSKCIGLADAALGRLQTLEKRADTANGLKKSGKLTEKVIIEVP